MHELNTTTIEQAQPTNNTVDMTEFTRLLQEKILVIDAKEGAYVDALYQLFLELESKGVTEIAATAESPVPPYKISSLKEDQEKLAAFVISLDLKST